MPNAQPCRPDFERVRRTVRREPTDRVPLIEALVDFSIQSQFLGRPVTCDDLPAQVEFWSQAGYDYVPLVLGMMRPGRVTEDSAISRLLQRTLAADGSEGDRKSTRLNSSH